MIGGPLSIGRSWARAVRVHGVRVPAIQDIAVAVTGDPWPGSGFPKALYIREGSEPMLIYPGRGAKLGPLWWGPL